MHTLGHSFVPTPIHAGGLRYHGDAPLLCLLNKLKIIEPVAYPQKTVFEAAVQFTRTEGILPAPETAHAVKAAIDEAIKCRESGEKKTIAFLLSRHGFFDMTAMRAISQVSWWIQISPRKKSRTSLQICLESNY